MNLTVTSDFELNLNSKDGTVATKWMFLAQYFQYFPIIDKIQGTSRNFKRVRFINSMWEYAESFSARRLRSSIL